MGIRQSVAEYVAEIGAYYEQYINPIHENGINVEYLEYVAEKYPLDMMDKVLVSIFNDLNILNRVHKMVLRFHFLKYMRQKRNASLASLALRLDDDFDGT